MRPQLTKKSSVPPFLRHPAVWQNSWPIIIGSVTVAGVLWVLARFLARDSVGTPGWFWVVTAFAMLGYVTGTLTGFSRGPAVGAVMPAVLTLAGGLAMLLVGKENSPRVLISASLIAFSFTFLVGTMWGAILREAPVVQPRSPSSPSQPSPGGEVPPLRKPPGGFPKPEPFPPGDSPFVPLPTPSSQPNLPAEGVAQLTTDIPKLNIECPISETSEAIKKELASTAIDKIADYLKQQVAPDHQRTRQRIDLMLLCMNVQIEKIVPVVVQLAPEQRVIAYVPQIIDDAWPGPLIASLKLPPCLQTSPPDIGRGKDRYRIAERPAFPLKRLHEGRQRAWEEIGCYVH